LDHGGSASHHHNGHHEIWINHIRSRSESCTCENFATVTASRLLRAIAKSDDLHTPTLHISSGLEHHSLMPRMSAFCDGRTSSDGVLIPGMPKNHEDTSCDLAIFWQILRSPSPSRKKSGPLRSRGLRQVSCVTRVDRLTGTEVVIKRSIWSVGSQPSKDTCPAIPCL